MEKFTDLIIPLIFLAVFVLNTVFNRITSYNVCYTKLLRAIENVMIPIDLRGERSAKNDAKSWLERLGLEKRMYSLPGES